MEEKEMEKEREEDVEVEQREEEGELPKPPFSNQQRFTCVSPRADLRNINS